jgi:rhamnopyranosyl-N-acetylglucosaminyl-diphospho-decaprenol beta-1,3/1,4-galactofuranosyltransferase
MSGISLKIAAVIVAFNRDDLLARSLEHTIAQSRKPDVVIVVDNANLDSTRILVESHSALYLNGALENGSAGGFAIGIDYAITADCDFVWTLDDDGYPDLNCLSTLLHFTIEKNLGVSSPLSLSQEDHAQTANPYLFGLKKITEVKKIQRKEIWADIVQFYNGALFSREIIKQIGLPKKELFLRGDEMDYYYRARRANAKMGLVTNAIFYHPSGVPEFANSRNSLFGVVVPKQASKLFYQFRNRGYLVREYSLIPYAIYDWIRYPVFFLIYPGRNLRGFMQWKSLWLRGFRRDLTPYRPD